RRLRVLLAEDNQINSVLATAILKRAGHHVDVAGNGVEAVETFTLAEYDIVLMDMRMPEMDGLEATKALRAAGHIDVPIIALTANAMGVDREACLQAGMNDFLSKPFDPNDLTRLLDRWTQKPPSDQIDISQTEEISSRTI
ncbi:MAG: response regulator, partial [Pseudomonadota bacterium]